SLGFAISIDKAKKDIEQVKNMGRISYPYMGVRYVVLDAKSAEERNISVDYGALLIKGDAADEPAVTSGSPAEKAGLKEGDIILEMGEEKVTTENTLSKMISKYNPNDSVSLKVLRDGKEIDMALVFGEWKQ
ncbi:MAG: PDZ domain-containing protein, partial [Candidatus Pacebacteria bacterium]|nr:PDZ domain-containing protein [Candidatus Paceibacterota bacterium]